MKALILAGGQGLRLRPLTDDKPKPLVPVNGKPIAEWQIDWLMEHVRLEKVIFLCGYRWEKLKEHFGTSYSGISIEYSVEETPLGTGGAFRKAISGAGIGDENLLMMNGDIITDMDLGDMVAVHTSAKAQPIITILLAPYKSRFGIVRIDKSNIVRKFEEKPEFPDVWINGGIYVANAQKILKNLPERGDIERETFPNIVGSGEIMAYPYRGSWSLIDSIKDIQEVESEMRSGGARKGTW
jgi:NDP-sugar pyrophosphorylase family protein